MYGRPNPKDFDKVYASYGAGVQSTALIILSALGKYGVPRMDFGIFSDTGAELPHTYEMLRLGRDFLQKHGIPLYVDAFADLESDATQVIKTKTDKAKYALKRKTMLPLWTISTKPVMREAGGVPTNEPLLKRDGTPVTKTTKGLNPRDCTADYKVAVIMRRVRRELGPKWRSKRALGMIGISTDEAQRMKPSQVRYQVSTWPLVDAGLSRDDCKQIVVDHGFPLPQRSACYFCPFHNDKEWAMIRDKYPDYWQKAQDLEAKLQDRTDQLNSVRDVKDKLGEMYLHKSRVPLGEADLQPDSADGQLNLFGNECAGICGV